MWPNVFCTSMQLTQRSRDRLYSSSCCARLFTQNRVCVCCFYGMIPSIISLFFRISGLFSHYWCRDCFVQYLLYILHSKMVGLLLAGVSIAWAGEF